MIPLMKAQACSCAIVSSKSTRRDKNDASELSGTVDSSSARQNTESGRSADGFRQVISEQGILSLRQYAAKRRWALKGPEERKRILSSATRAAQLANTGRLVSAETRHKRSEAAKRQWMSSPPMERSRLGQLRTPEEISVSRKEWHKANPNWARSHMLRMHEEHPEMYKPAQEAARKAFLGNEGLAKANGGGWAICGHLCRSQTELEIHAWLAETPHLGEQQIQGTAYWCDIVLAGEMVEVVRHKSKHVLSKYQGTGTIPVMVTNKEWSTFQLGGFVTSAIKTLMILKLQAQTIPILPMES